MSLAIGIGIGISFSTKGEATPAGGGAEPTTGILLENSDFLLAENGDFIVQE